METKRLILAVALSMVVLIVFPLLFKQEQPVNTNYRKPAPKTQQQTPATNSNVYRENESKPRQADMSKDVAEKSSESKEQGTEGIKESAPLEKKIEVAAKEEVVRIETKYYTAEFTNRGAALKSFVLLDYMDDGSDEKQALNLVSEKIDLQKGDLYPFHFSTFDDRDPNRALYTESNKTLFNVEKVDSEKGTKLVFKYTKGVVNVTKTFILYKNSYVIGLDSQFIDNGRMVPAPYVFGPYLGNRLRSESMMAELKLLNGEDVEDKMFRGMAPGFQPAGKLNGYNYPWAAFDSTYFSVIFKMDLRSRDSRVMTYIEELTTPEGEKNRKNYLIATNPSMVFMGPKEERILESVELNYGFSQVYRTINYGWSLFAPIAKLLLKGINFVYDQMLSASNYGWAIVIFTIFIKLLLFPLTYKSSVSMAKMQTLQPKMKALKKKYKNQKDPAQRRAMNEELMALYRTEKVNPAGGCLPMLLQMPILFAFFMLLRSAINLRHEEWIFWIKDLSLKDPTLVLPVLMGLTMLIQQKLTPSSGDATQKKMMYIMPVFITFIAINLGSGLVLYWFVSNLLQIGQQKYINKKIYQQKKDADRELKAAKKKKGVKRV